MILRKITLTHWRGIAARDIDFASGVNILYGPNEAGKTTTVEAIEWALYRDIVGGVRVKDEILPIIPATDRNLRPTVTAHLEFEGCTAVVTKTLAETPAARACSLQIVRADGSVERLDQEDAQLRLKSLLAADGLGTAGAPSDAGLLISRQGVAAAYVGEEMSVAVRSTLKVEQDGAVTATSRLEAVRAELARQRKNSLNKKLGEQAIEAAPAGSEAAQLRQQLDALRQERDEFAQCVEDIADLRARIDTLRDEVHSLEPRAAAAHAALADLRARRDAQQNLSREFAECRAGADAAAAARAALQHQVDEIARLREGLRVAEGELQQAGVALTAARTTATELAASSEMARSAAIAAELLLEEARARDAAWQLRQRFHDARKACKEIEARVAELETLAAAAATAREKSAALPAWPTSHQCFKIKSEFQNLAQLRRSAGQQLQVTVMLRENRTLQVRSDDGEARPQDAPAAAPVTLHGVQSVAFTIPDIGDVTVHCGARELRQQAAEIEKLTADLTALVAPFGLTVAELPAAFETLESLAEQGEAAARELQMAQAALTSCEQRFGQLDHLRVEQDESRAALEAARAACEPVRDVVSGTAADRDRDAVETRRREQAAAAAHRAAQDALGRVHEHGGYVGGLQTQAERLEERVAGMRGQLAKLTADGLPDADRAARLESLRRDEWTAAQALAAVEEKIGATGGIVTEDDIESAESDAAAIVAARQACEVGLAGMRAELNTVCARDPVTHIEALDARIAELAPQLDRHEARLRALVILDAVLAADRNRLGRTLAAPMNQLLAPWLSRLRGQETQIEFDTEGRAITGVRTGQGAATITLPFGDHSEGFKEQVAFVLRLILAGRLAATLPSRRLPVILDDPLTQTDNSRRVALYQVLNEAAANLQILFVTCHAAHCDGIQAPHTIRLGADEPIMAEPVVTQPAVACMPAIAPSPRAVRKRKTPDETAADEPLSLW